MNTGRGTGIGPWLRRVASAGLLLCAASVAQAQGSAQDLADGKALGNARAGETVTSIKNGSARSTVQNITSNPPQAALYTSTNLSSQTAAQRAACLANPNDPVCAGQNLVMTARPKQYISASDPALAGDAVTKDPSLILGNITDTYSACSNATTVVSPAQFSTRQCSITTPGWNTNTCSKTLTSLPVDRRSCIPKQWFTKGSVNRNSLDSMQVEGMCDPVREDGMMKFHAYASGAEGACADWQEFMVDIANVTPPAGQMPQEVALVQPHWGGACQRVHVYQRGPGCSGGQCSKTFDFLLEVPGGCTPATENSDPVCTPTQVGGFKPILVCRPGLYAAYTANDPSLTWYDGTSHNGSGSGSVAHPPIPGHCYSKPFLTDPTAYPPIVDEGLPDYPTGAFILDEGPGHWAINLSFAKPTYEANAGDTWTNTCTAYEEKVVGGATPLDGTNPPPGVVMPALTRASPNQCVRTNSVCVDGPSTKVVDGIPVNKECWQYQNTFDCTTLDASSTCNASAFSACTQSGAVVCNQVDASGRCLNATVDMSCKVQEAVYGPAVNCGSSMLCPNGVCPDTSYTPDADFAKSVTMLEASREAAQYVDVNTLKIFKGADNRCVNRLYGLTRCCSLAGSPAAALFTDLKVVMQVAGMAASSTIAAAKSAATSAYTYDGLFKTEAPSFSQSGFQSLFNGGSGGDVTTSVFMEGLVPGYWTIAMMAIQLSGLLECSQEEKVTAMKNDAHLCHQVGGDWCSKKDTLGFCLEKTRTHCCFPSRLARIINEQGRAQLGMGWGTERKPDCDGFLIAQLENLDFSRMDLTEFYAEINPSLPDMTNDQRSAVDKANACYFGAGKC